MLNETLRKEFLAALKKAGLAKHADALLEEARECLHFNYQKPKGKLKPGATKVGGLPDLPDSVEWPDGADDKGKPFGKAEFLAQFDCAGIPAVPGLDLPRTGHLWIFVRNSSLISMPTAVIYRDGDEPLKPRKKPRSGEPEYGWRDLNAATLQFRPGISLPLSSKRFQRKFAAISDKLVELGETLSPGLDNYGPRDGVDGQIGGYSYQAEIDVCRDLAFEEMGRSEYQWADYWSSLEELDAQIKQGLPFLKTEQQQREYREELKGKRSKLEWIVKNDAEIQKRADSLQLLCMFRPDDDIGLEFGDGMYTDLLIHREALAKRDFSKVYCICPMLL